MQHPCSSTVWKWIAVVPVLGVAATVLLRPAPVHASLPVQENWIALTSFAAAPGGGFWVQLDYRYNSSSRTGTYPVDGAPNLGSVPGSGSIVAVPGRNGYWVVADYGGIAERGDAPVLCGRTLQNCSGFQSGVGGNIVAAAATQDGQGLWAVGQDGKVWTAGSAQSYGDAQHGWSYPAYYASGIAATPSGRGYVIVNTNGTVKAFGDAKFYGDTGGKRHGGHHATGIALSLDKAGNVNGYWVVDDDGGVFSYGQAPFLGSSGGDDGGSKVTNILALSGGRSYAWIHQDGRIDFSRPPVN